MKRIKYLGAIIIALAIGTGIYAFGFDQDAPKMVKEAFVQKFPEVKKVKWEKENETEWEGEFKRNGLEYSANFLEDGTWVETEYEINKKNVPANIQKTLDSEYPGYTIEAAEISETVHAKVYEFEIENGETELEVVIDLKGKIIGRSTEKD